MKIYRLRVSPSQIAGLVVIAIIAVLTGLAIQSEPARAADPATQPATQPSQLDLSGASQVADERRAFIATQAGQLDLQPGARGPARGPATRGALETADQPHPKVGRGGATQPAFETMHESFLARGKAGPIGVLFLGDSITQLWTRAPDIYKSHYDQYQPANFGIGGDLTQHVLWRIANGELDNISPKVVVLLIGTNNIGYPNDQIIAGDKKIIEQIHLKLPNTKLLILGIFPRGNDPASPATAALRAKLQAVNAELAKLDDGKQTRYLEIWNQFLDKDGILQPDIMNDYLHPTVKGYQIWADAMQPLLDEMMK
jgi:beta-glucosidase